MTLKRNSFDVGQPDGTAVSIGNSSGGVGNSALSLVNTAGGTIVYDDDHAALTALAWSVLITNATTGNPTAIGMSDTGSFNWGISVYIYMTGYPSVGGSFGIRGQTTAAGQSAKLYITTTGQLQIVGSFGTFNATGPVVPLNQWCRWEFWSTGNGTNSTVNGAWFSGHGTTAQDTVTTGSVANTADIAEFRVGRVQSAMNMNPFAITGWQQNIGSGTAIGAWPTNLLPTANAGADQVDKEPYTTITVDGSSSSDPDGTIADYTWSVVSTTNGAATPSLSGSGATRTFKAPGAILGTDVTLGLTVTDDDGGVSTQDTCVVSVLPVTERIVSGGVEVPFETQVVVP